MLLSQGIIQKGYTLISQVVKGYFKKQLPLSYAVLDGVYT